MRLSLTEVIDYATIWRGSIGSEIGRTGEPHASGGEHRPCNNRRPRLRASSRKLCRNRMSGTHRYASDSILGGGVRTVTPFS